MSSQQSSITKIKTLFDIPARREVSAVFLIGFAYNKNKLLVCRNERGWDIPGGHLEAEESLEQGLRREVIEEAGAVFESFEPLCTLTLMDKSAKIMVFFSSKNISLKCFKPTEDAIERKIVSPDNFLKEYYGDIDLMKKILMCALQRF